TERRRRAHRRSRCDDARAASDRARQRCSSVRDSSDRRIARERVLLPRRPMSGLLNRTVMWLTWRQLFARRRIWLAVAFALAPLLFTLVFMVVGDDGTDARVGFLGVLQRDIVIGTLLPLAAVIFGTTAFGGEVDDGTLVYLLVKPIPRWQVVLS